MKKHNPLLLFLLLITLSTNAFAQDVRPLELSQQTYIRADNLGLTFIAYLDNIGKDAQTRYRQALEMGAGWNRYPIYWNVVEPSPGGYNWGGYDALVDADRAAGLKTNAILLSMPDFYNAGGIPAGLYEPVFADGTDQPAFGKAINPNNHWARFVYETVNRYRPGGTLAQSRRTFTGGIRVWEVWNEPDLDLFWQGNYDNYARLLKVAYIAAKQADNSAQVMFGGLAYGNPDTEDFLSAVLNIIGQDPDRDQYNWYMDIVGLHSYNEARRTGLVVSRVRNTLSSYGRSTPVWLNETGVPVWDDYPGPTGAANDPGTRRLHATMEQQAAFVIQSASYAFAAGAEKVFFHQFYDDCGDAGSGGSNAYGFYRNPAGYECFAEHQFPGTARPAVEAYHTLAGLLGQGQFESSNVFRRADGSVFIEFDRANSDERVTVIWNERLDENTITWTADSAVGVVYGYGNQRFNLSPIAGEYTVTLPPARVNDDPNRPPGQTTAIGGRTFLMVERVPQEQTMLDAGVAEPGVAVVTPRAPLPSTVGSILDGSPNTGASIATLADITPPITRMDPLPETSPQTFNVSWSGTDAGGIAKFLVWVRVNDGEWGPWLETTRTSAEYTGVSGNVYSFAVWAVDNAGNWSLNTDLRPQAYTTVQ